MTSVASLENSKKLYEVSDFDQLRLTSTNFDIISGHPFVSLLCIKLFETNILKKGVD